MTWKTVFIFLGILFLSCNDQPKVQQQPPKIETPQSKTYENVSIDSLHQLMEQVKHLDNFQYDNPANDPFIFLKSGFILTDTQKNAIVIQMPNDSTYTLELYTLKDNQWIRNDSLSNLEGNLVQFYLELKDFNFDRIKDIYLQSSISNGISFSYGNLLTIDPKTYELKLHPETRNLGNLSPDFKSKTLVSERVIQCKENGLWEICTTTHNWHKEKLIYQKEVCPCK